MRRRHEMTRADGIVLRVAACAATASKWGLLLRAAQRQQQLCVQVQPALGDGGAQVGDDVDVGKAPDQALVGFLEDLDAVAAAVIGGLAGGLGGREGVGEFLRARLDGGDADADRDHQRAIADRGAEQLGALAQRFGEAGRVVEADRQQHREAIARYARRQRPGRQAIADQLAELRDDLVADVHAVVVVDDVHAVGVDRQRAPPALGAAGLAQRALHAMFEGRPVQQARSARRSCRR